ncbi:MAG: FAD/NAD(P)-binding protein [Sphingomicrobium sp.]
MKSDRGVPVAIVGGGFSGTMIAAQLARRGIGSVLIDGSGRLGKGVAYSTTEPAHLLNVPAEAMSAWPEDPEHFARRVETDGGNRRGYAQRRLFGHYLGEVLDEAVASGRTEAIAATALGAKRKNGRWTVELGDGSAVESRALVLAVGNQEPGPLSAFAGIGDRFVSDPWGSSARKAVEDLAASGDPTLLIGTGLTMVDLVLSLNAAGHQGRIIALSRRGLVPHSHADYAEAPIEAHEVPSGDLRALFRWLRRRSAEVGWRAAVDSLRPHTQSLWQSLDQQEQLRFLRHARAWWDVRRSRIAPEVASTIAALIGEGRLEIMAGRAVSARDTGEALEVDIRRRGAPSAQTLRFACAFNCTGPLHAIASTRDPLLRSLIDAGQVRPDRLGIALQVDEHSRASGGERIWALGPLTRGCYWEIIAVPDIREQAAAVADDIAREIER